MIVLFTILQLKTVAATSPVPFTFTRDTTGITTCDSLIGKLPPVLFKETFVRLNNKAKQTLDAIATRLRLYPDCKIAVWAGCSTLESQMLPDWRRVENVILYLTEKHKLSKDRFVYFYISEYEDCNIVGLRALLPDDLIPNDMPPPHPNLKRQ
ncbi:MAG: hypothetical protein NTW29_08725 [Bacteroidetes bacterium]|nr:hypothetical protein [Bacteroidota bacterium]